MDTISRKMQDDAERLLHLGPSRLAVSPLPPGHHLDTNERFTPKTEIKWMVTEDSMLAFTRVELFNQRGHGVGDGVSCHQEVVPQVPSGT